MSIRRLPSHLVDRIAADPEARTVVLDRTAFYPGGGGQPSDAGTLAAADGGVLWQVTAAKKEGAVVVHLVLDVAGAEPWDSVTKCLLAPLLAGWVLAAGGPRPLDAGTPGRRDRAAHQT